METPGKSIPETLLDADSQANVTVDAFTFSKLIHPLRIEFKKIPFVSSVFKSFPCFRLVLFVTLLPTGGW